LFFNKIGDVVEISLGRKASLTAVQFYEVRKNQIYLGLGIAFLQRALANFWNKYPVAIRCKLDVHL